MSVYYNTKIKFRRLIMELKSNFWILCPLCGHHVKSIGSFSAEGVIRKSKGRGKGFEFKKVLLNKEQLREVIDITAETLEFLLWQLKQLEGKNED